MTPCAAWRCFLTTPDSGARLLALLASGRRHGPITRLITPWNITLTLGLSGAVTERASLRMRGTYRDGSAAKQHAGC
jgi:hypothetical protein